MFWFGAIVNRTETEKGGVYLLSPTEYADAISNNGSIQMKAENLMGKERYQTNLLNRVLHNLIPVSFVFLAMLFLLSLCLWSILRRVQNDRTIKIAQQLNDATTEVILSEEPVLASTYKSLKEKFDSQMSDFKRLSAYLAHEQKNQVAILRTRLELSENNEDLKKLDDITDSIDDILTLSENADTSPIVPVDVSVICAEVFDSYHKTAKNITFNFEGDEDTEILARSRWVYRAVANLLDNAIKYGQGLPIDLSVRAKNGSVIVTVKDQGIGISEDKQDIIFSDRYRINELNKDGYGIGLSLVSHVCDLCGGFVMVESEIDKGSTLLKQNSPLILLSVVGVMVETIAIMIVYITVIEKKYKQK